MVTSKDALAHIARRRRASNQEHRQAFPSSRCRRHSEGAPSQALDLTSNGVLPCRFEDLSRRCTPVRSLMWAGRWDVSTPARVRPCKIELVMGAILGQTLERWQSVLDYQKRNQNDRHASLRPDARRSDPMEHCRFCAATSNDDCRSVKAVGRRGRRAARPRTRALTLLRLWPCEVIGRTRSLPRSKNSGSSAPTMASNQSAAYR